MAQTARKLQKKPGKSHLKILSEGKVVLRFNKTGWGKAERIALRDVVVGLRTAYGMDQNQLAAKAGVSNYTVSAIENMENRNAVRKCKVSPMFRTVILVLTALGVKVEVVE